MDRIFVVYKPSNPAWRAVCVQPTLDITSANDTTSRHSNGQQDLKCALVATSLYPLIQMIGGDESRTPTVAASSLQITVAVAFSSHRLIHSVCSTIPFY